MQEPGYGVDLHRESLKQAKVVLVGEGLDANHLPHSDVFDVPTPDQLGCPLPLRDAIIGNPPFVRYQEHTGEACKKSIAAALRQGVRLNGLASSWAATLVHACAFSSPR
jgi:adenine-specific DNA-methyltransferase